MTRTVPTLLALFFLPATIALQARAESNQDLPPADSIKPELYATGFEFSEGPALDREGNLYVVNYRGNGNIGRITPDGTASVFCDLREMAPLKGREPRANGLKVDSQGRLIVADYGTARVLRIPPDGESVEVLAARCEGKRFGGINDVALDLEGNIYMSDPGGSSPEHPIGSIYRYDIRTAKVSRLDSGLIYPNGLAVTPDQKHLCLSESRLRQMLIYDLTPEGKAINRRVLTKLPGEEFVPDGMVFDKLGRLYVATWTAGVICVIEIPSGEILRQYDAGGNKVTNVHFFGDYLYTTVAAKEAVFRIKLGVPGFDYNRGMKNQ